MSIPRALERYYFKIILIWWRSPSKGLSMRFLGLFLACMDTSRPECEPLMVLKFLWSSFAFWQLFYVLVRFIPNLPTKRIDNCLIETLILLKNILGEPLNWLSIILGDSTNLQEVLTPFAVFLGGPLTQNKEKLENRILSCQSFSNETHQYFKLLSKIEETSLKCKTRSGSLSGLYKSIQAKK